jgi:hypothetical protein
MCTRRAFYWHSDEPKARLMRFSLQDRTFAVVSRPPVGGDDRRVSLNDEMVDLHGKLCYVHAAAEASSFHVWLADDDSHGDELQWWLHCRIDLNPDPICWYLRPVISDGGKMMFRASFGEDSYDHLMWCSVPKDAREEMVDLQHQLRYTRLIDGSKYMRQSKDLFDRIYTSCLTSRA